MSMSTHILGFKPPDKRWKEMKAIWDSCEQAGVNIPKAVLDFFNGEPPDESGVKIEIEVGNYCRRYEDEMIEGFEIEIDKLPKDIKMIRFYNSW